MHEPTWHAVSREGSTDLLRVGEDAEAYIAEWPGRLLQRVGKSELRSELQWLAPLEPRARQKFLSGPVQAFERHARGKLSLHAGAMARDGRALAVLGLSGAGKSTCVYDACMRAGWDFVADDVVHIDTTELGAPEVRRTEDIVALTPETRAHFGLETESDLKTLLDAPASATQAWPLSAVVELGFGDVAVPELRRLRGVAALSVLMASQVRLVLASASVHAHDLEMLERLMGRLPVYRLVRPRAFEQMPHAEQILRHLVAPETPSL